MVFAVLANGKAGQGAFSVKAERLTFYHELATGMFLPRSLA
jgi:hypothetical protein